MYVYVYVLRENRENLIRSSVLMYITESKGDKFPVFYLNMAKILRKIVFYFFIIMLII